MDHITPTPRYAEKMLEKALRLYTPSMSEGPLAEFLADKCDDLGFEDIRIDEAGNLVARKGRGRPVIMLCSHMDTVPGRIRVRRDGDLLYGRGSSDAKGPLMAMLFAAASASDCTVVFVGAVDEEGNAAGIKHLASQKLDIDYAIFGEPSGLHQVTVGYKGRLAISLRVDAGDSSHASAPWLSKNAIEESAVFTARLKKALESGQEGRQRALMLTATVTEVKGGTSHNVTPKECETTMDIRIPADAGCKAVEERIATAVREISRERGVEAFYSILDETEPFETEPRSMLVRALTLAVRECENEHPSLIRKTGTGDMNVIGNRMSVPVVTYGPGDPHLAHTMEERISVDEYLRGIEVLKAAIRQIKRLHDRESARRK